jgi:methylated-DNA-[protein]-cysteine S-methyltransferase
MSTFQLSFKTKLGVITVKESEGYITDINFRKITKQKKSSELLKAKKEIKQFLDKKIKKLSFKSKTVGTETQLKVWNEIKKIGYGRTVSYNFISKRTKIHPRHVGRICGQNRLLLFIPCHRVIRSSGLIGGFSAKGGVNLKNKILKFEKLNK